MAVLVEDVMPAKTGKSLRVKLGGTWYGAKLDSGLNGKKGQMIEAEITTGKFGPWIDAWRPSANQPAPATAPQSPNETTRERLPQYAEPAKPGTVAPYWLPMASNVVAHGIAAGKIENPNQVAAWVRAVKMAVENDASEDDVPY
jgi:hypothetical protein